MAWHRTGDKPLSEPRLLAHMYVTRPLWIETALFSSALEMGTSVSSDDMGGCL